MIIIAMIFGSLRLPAVPTTRAAALVAWGADGTAFASNPGDEQALPQGYQNTFHYNPLSRDDGFTFVGWRDARDSALHVQKLDADGVGQWGSAGVTIDGSVFNVFNIITRPDGAGGVYVIWEQGSNINVLRLDDDGGVHSGWSTTGTAASTNYFDTQGAVLDGSGGIIVIYDVFGGHVRGTRVLPDGTTDWENQLIIDAGGYCTIDVGHAVSDGTGGVFIGWYGYLCDDFIAHYHLLRLDDDGSVSAGWDPDGELIDSWSPFDDSARGFDLVADGSGGVFFTWQRPDPVTFGSGRDVRIQHYDSSGNELWTAGGVYVTQDDDVQQDQPHVVTDGSGEAVVSYRVDEDHISAQRLNSSGATQWTAGGITILDNTQNMQGVPVTDNAGGLIVAWEGLFVQRWSSSATKLWGVNGTQASSIMAFSQPFLRLLSNDANGVVMVFESSDSPTQIIAQQVCEDACPTSGGGGSDDPTLSNAVTMSRLKVSTASTVAISFDLQNQLDGTFTATFPVGFSVTGAFTQGTCSGSGTVDTFAFNAGSRTMTAEKHACSGTLSLSGGTVTNPSSPGFYAIAWTNDDPGEGGVAIVDDDQVTVSAQVAAFITFDIDTAVTDTESAAPYAVALGTITTTDTRVSGATDGVNSIWLDLTSNAGAGVIVTVRNANGADGLVSTAFPADDIDSANGTMADGTENYGICSISEADAGGNLDDLAPYDGTCAADSETNVVGGLSTTPTPIYDTDGAPISGGRARIGINAAISTATAAHNDYTDTLTFIATGTF